MKEPYGIMQETVNGGWYIARIYKCFGIRITEYGLFPNLMADEVKIKWAIEMSLTMASAQRKCRAKMRSWAIMALGRQQLGNMQVVPPTPSDGQP